MAVRTRAGRLRRLVGGARALGRSRGLGDRLLIGLSGLAALLALAVLGEVVYQVIKGADPAISKFGLAFVIHARWAPNFGAFGAAVLIYGTLVTSLLALALAMPIGISIGIYLSLLARPAVRSVVGPLVELLAAIPSVILGFWGLLVLAPLVQRHLAPWLHGALGFIPIFGPPQTTGVGLFTAALVLTIMIVPIIAALSRDLFLTVPRELRDGAAALGATRWEVIRGVVLPTTAPGVVAASILGLGRALGEAIAVTQVIGAGNLIHASVFETGDTLASRIADQFPEPSPLGDASLFYLALILLVIGLTTNLLARRVSRRFDVQLVIGR